MNKNMKAKLFTFSFLVLLGFSFVSLEFVYAEEEYNYSIDELILSATGYFDANVTIKPPGETRSFSKVLSVRLDNVPELPGDVGVSPSYEQKDSKEDYSAMAILGSKNYLVKNYTKDLELASKNITDAFDLATYYELSVDNLKTLDTSSNSKITVYFANDTSVNYLAATSVDVIDALFTRQFDYHQDLIYCSPDMNANVSVVRITLTNIACDGFYLYAHSGGHHYVDTRNMGYWINNYDAEISAQGEDSVNNPYQAYIAPGSKISDYSLDATMLGQLNNTKLSAVPDLFYSTTADMNIKVWGWEDVDELEADLYAAWVEASDDIDDIDDIVDYTILTGHFGFILSDTALAIVKEKMEQLLSTTDDYIRLVQETLGSTFPMLGVTNIVEPDEIIDPPLIYSLTSPEDPNNLSLNDFWCDVGDFFKNIAGGVTSTVNNLINTIPDVIDSVGSAGGELLSPICQTVESTSTNAAGMLTNVVDTAGNMVTNTAGTLTSGIVGIGGCAADLGGNIMSSLKLPLIIIGIAAVGLVGIYLLIRFSMPSPVSIGPI